jgi:hypothetical protein
LESHDGIYVGVASAASASSADYSAAANAFKQKQHQDWSLFYTDRRSKQITLGYKSFLIQLQEFLG